jgi:hypothetical protein
VFEDFEPIELVPALVLLGAHSEEAGGVGRFRNGETERTSRDGIRAQRLPLDWENETGGALQDQVSG